MNVFLNIRSRIVVSVFAVNFAVFPLSLTAEPISQLTGKNLGQNRDLVNAAMRGRNYVVEVGQHGEIKQVLDAGANGSGKDAQQVVALVEADKNQESTQAVTSVAMPESYQGQLAIDYMGTDLPKIAASYGLSEDKLKNQFLTDSSIRIDKTNHIFYVEEEAEGVALPAEDMLTGATAEATTANGLALPIDASPVTADAFKLHSKPGASKTIYLDFDGHTASNTAWSATTIQAPAFDLDANPAVFSDTERKAIISVWSRVAEDYAPFDVDITTEQPADSALIRAGSTDTVYGTRVVITKKGTISCTCGGIAYVNVVAMVNATRYQPAWVFQESLGNSEKNIAEAVSHEAGHTLGLFHDGQKTATSTVGYYTGHGTGATGWAPIMGVGYYKNMTQWSKGEYPNANNLQDDFAVLASNGFVQRTDDVGNTLVTASPFNIDASATAQTTQKTGTIESSSDIDMYRLDTAGGPLSVTVKPVATGPNLDTALTLFDGNGAVIAASAPESELSATISQTITAGTYYLAVKGSARAAVGSDYGYPASASLGQYSLTGTYQSTGTVAAPTNVSSPAGSTAPTPVAKVFASSLKIKVIRGNNVSATVGIIVTNEKNQRIPNALVWGKWSGAFSSKVGKKANANGEVIQLIAKKGKSNGGAATFTLTGIDAPGYVYSADRNAKSVVTATW